jgi:hypothetical protein
MLSPRETRGQIVATKKITPRQQITESTKVLKKLMEAHLDMIGANFVSDIMKGFRNATPANRINVTKDVTAKGVNDYKADLLEALASLSVDALDLARKEVPKAKNVELADIDDLPPDLRKKLKARVDLLIGKQISDLQSEVNFAYQTNQVVLGGDEELEYFLNESAASWVGGTSVQAGASITSATVISDAREAFFFDDDVKEEIDAFEFVNGDPVTPICTDLEGTVFDKDDPDLFRYTPPLHWNCKSYIRPILKGNLGNRQVEKLRPSSKKIEETIQFVECDHYITLDRTVKACGD